jgi:plastocyanin
MNRLLVTLAAVAAFLVVAMPASARTEIQITIHHQLHGCHAWAVGTGAFKASQSLHVAAGTEVVVKNTDLMPHRLVQLAGPAVTFTNLPSASTMMGMKGPFAPGMMGRMNSSTELTLTKPGTYRFTTKAGEDYMAGVKTTGEDNVLKLTVVVS